MSHDCGNSAQLKCIGNDYCGELILLNSHAVEGKALGLTFKPFKELIASSDALSLHVPLTEETKFLIGRKEINLMRPVPS
ncbi:MAG: hypothetical protein DRH11_01415 [Deltaproteobacteria bacterium]|nr:MAG: hypothetical protein DRH11_01415 [Deltaproteobacteria bacterium]